MTKIGFWTPVCRQLEESTSERKHLNEALDDYLSLSSSKAYSINNKQVVLIDLNRTTSQKISHIVLCALKIIAWIATFPLTLLLVMGKALTIPKKSYYVLPNDAPFTKIATQILTNRPNNKDLNGQTALHHAVTTDPLNFTLIQMLLQMRADTNCTDMSKKTPLHYAVLSKQPNLDVIKLLCRNGANVNSQDAKLKTPLHYAVQAEEPNLDLVKYFCEEGANTLLTDTSQMTALHHAVISSKTDLELIKVLLIDQAPLIIQDNKGRTPLHYAVTLKKPNLDLIELLLEQGGASITIKDNAGKTPLETPFWSKNCIKESAKDYLKHSKIKDVILKLYPPTDPENTCLYPITATTPNPFYFERTFELELTPHHALNHPDDVLEVLGDLDWIENFRIKYYGGSGIDDGGLSRQFISQLLQGMIEKSKRLKFAFDKTHRAYPTSLSMDQLGVEETKALRQLGNLLRIANKKAMPVGRFLTEKTLKHLFLMEMDTLHIFNNSIYKLTAGYMFSLKSYIDDSKRFFFYINKSARINYISEFFDCDDSILSKIKVALLGDDQECIHIAKELNEGWWDDELKNAIEQNDVPKMRQQIEENWISPYVMLRNVRIEIAKTFHTSFCQSIDRNILRKRDNLPSFLQRIVGHYSAEDLKNQIVVTHSIYPLAQQQDNIKKWIDKWIDDHKNNEKEIGNLIQALTGAPALTKRLNINISIEVDRIVIHTCRYRVDIPSHITEDSLRAAFDTFAQGDAIDFNAG